MTMYGARWMYAIGLVGALGCPDVGAEEQSPAPAKAMSEMQHGGMQHGGNGAAASQPQGGMQGMQHGEGAGMMGGMGGGMMGGMMGSMSEPEQLEAWQKLQAQDIRLGELRRQIRESNDQTVRDKLKSEHLAMLKEQLALMHKLMMQAHMKSMKGGMSMGGSGAPAPAPPANP